MTDCPHNPKAVGSNPASATNVDKPFEVIQAVYFLLENTIFLTLF